ncbi:MAG TPA: YIP1 family protein [Thermoplasmatales archaeon]|nr:YIP1 family protein [Thermoplasmatales archaeon]
MEKECFTVTLTFSDKIKGFILNPVETFKGVKEENIVFALRYYISLTIVESILYGIVYTFMFSSFYSSFDIYKWNKILGMDKEISGMLIIILMIISNVIGLFIGGAWMHLWIRAFGGKEKYYHTIKAIAYGNTPNLLLGWLPFINLAGAIWSLVLVIIGIKEFHKMSAVKVLLAIIVSGLTLAIIISTIVFLVLAWLFFSTG